LYQEHVEARTGAALAFSIEDHLHQIRLAACWGLSDEDLARNLGVPVDYIRSMRATLQE
jgi:hypothetical protein